MKQSDFNYLFGLLLSVSLSSAVPLLKNTEETGNSTYRDNVCIWEENEYSSGEVVPSPGPCEQCICQPPKVECTMIKCKTNSGCKMIQRANHCCPLFKCDCEYKGRVYNNGERLENPDDPCQVCYCKGGEIMCTSLTCYERVDCEPHYVPGQCCPKYDHCPLESQKNGNKSANSLVFGSKREIQPWLMTKPVTVKPIEKVKQTTAKREEFVPVNNIYPQTLKIHEILPTTAKYDHPNRKRPVAAHIPKPSTEKANPSSTSSSAELTKRYDSSESASLEESTSESIDESTTLSAGDRSLASESLEVEESNMYSSDDSSAAESVNKSDDENIQSTEESSYIGQSSEENFPRSEKYNSTEEITSSLPNYSSEEILHQKPTAFEGTSDYPEIQVPTTEAAFENINNISDSSSEKSEINNVAPDTVVEVYDEAANLLNLTSDLSVWDEITTENYFTLNGAEPTETVKIRSVGNEGESTLENRPSTQDPNYGHHIGHLEQDQTSDESNISPVETMTTEEAPYVLKGGVYQVVNDTSPKNVYFEDGVSVPVNLNEESSEINKKVMEVSRSYSGVRRSDEWASSGYESFSAEDMRLETVTYPQSYNNDYSFESSGDSMYHVTQGHEMIENPTESSLDNSSETLKDNSENSLFEKIKDVEGESGLHLYVTGKNHITNNTIVHMVLSPQDLKSLALTLLKDRLDLNETTSLEVGWLSNKDVSSLGPVAEASSLNLQLLKCKQPEELEVNHQSDISFGDIEGDSKESDYNATNEFPVLNEMGSWTNLFTHKMATNMMIPLPDVEFISTTDVDIEETVPPETHFSSTTERVESISNEKIVNHTVQPMRVYEVLKRVTSDGDYSTEGEKFDMSSSHEKSDILSTDVSPTSESHNTIKKNVFTSDVPEVEGNRIENNDQEESATVNSSDDNFSSYELEDESSVVTTVDPSMTTKSGATLVSRKVPNVEPFLRQLPSSLDEHDVSILREFLERHFTES